MNLVSVLPFKESDPTLNTINKYKAVNYCSEWLGPFKPKLSTSFSFEALYVVILKNYRFRKKHVGKILVGVFQY